jgi:transposase-like protein
MRNARVGDSRAGHYERGLQTKAGEVRPRVPKLRRQTFDRRRESSVEEELIEMYLAGVSVRRVEDGTPQVVHAAMTANTKAKHSRPRLCMASVLLHPFGVPASNRALAGNV